MHAMHDPDALYHQPRCRCTEDEEKVKRQKLEMHRRYMERMAPIHARDRRFRRVGQTILGAGAIVALALFGSLLMALYQWMNGGGLEWLDSAVASINIGGAATAFTVLRMLLAWRKRRGSNPIGRTADTVAAVYRP